jgi:lysophospholipase L1-like esterase
VPKGLKTNSPTQTYVPNISGLLPSTGYTIIIDTDTPNSLQSGPVLSLSNGAVANRIQIDRSSNYNASFVVQSGGSVVVNAQLGAVQAWYGGPRRLVISCAPNVFTYADDGQAHGVVTSGALPTGLNRLDIGWSSIGATYFPGWIKRVRVLPFALTTEQAVNLSAGPSPIACWGDSLTFGTGATGQANTYPEKMRLSRYPHSGVYNGGVGGETSTQIATRALADPIRKKWTTVIWVGRNNFTNLGQVVSDAQSIAANLGHSRFVVMSVINRADGTESAGSTAYNQIMALNAALRSAFPNNYLDIRSMIVVASGGSSDAPNNSWTSDGLHLNNTGYAYVVGAVSSYLSVAGWY